MSCVIREGMEWQIRELSEAAIETANEADSEYAYDATYTYDVGYAQGVGEVLRMLIADDMDAARRDSEDLLTKIYERYREKVL